MRKDRSSWLRKLAFVLLILFAAEAVFLSIKWPFTRGRMETSLLGSTGSRVRFATFHPKFFPHPGFEAGEVSFERGDVKLATVRKLSIEGSWAALFTLQRYVRVMRLDGLSVSLPEPIPPAEPSQSKQESETTIGELVAHGAVLDARGYRIEFPKLTLRNAGRSRRLVFETETVIPKPAGIIAASGSFGPWQDGRTPVSGSFRVPGMDLGGVGEIEGTVNASGKFRGTLERISVTGVADSPNFRVKRHAVSVHTDYLAAVNATTGEVFLNDVRSRFLGTLLFAKGAVQNKTASLDFTSNEARIQDLLLLFTQGERAALLGPITLRAHVELPPGDEKFLRRLRLNGDFGIQDARFTRARTQTKVNELSARASGEDVGEDDPLPENVVSDLKGRVVLRKGLANLSDVSFSVPGARANGGGTYDLIDKRVNLTGKIAMEASLSDASGGIKSVLLKPFNVFFRRKDNKGAVLPVSVTGYYPRPKFQVSLTGK